jgi:hypothetical protein
MENQIENVNSEEFNLRKPTIKDKIKERWLKTLIEENPEINTYMVEMLIETYLLEPEKTEELLKKYC